MEIDRSFWQGRRVLLTGHTGFKGSWLVMMLHSLGSVVSGYALSPPTRPSLFDLCRLQELMHLSVIGDVRDGRFLTQTMVEAAPELVIHMAAQPLVRESYRIPVDTYAVNVMGTVNLLEAVRQTGSVRAVINVTTDKCYENKEWHWGYRENEPLGGHDPYSSSKACSELITASYRSAFFTGSGNGESSVALASARAGNVIGGGDWAQDRLIVDCIRALQAGQEISIRNPLAVRPWQHVLEPLSGYLMLFQKLFNDGQPFAQAWNFGPVETDARPVEWIVQRLCSLWGNGVGYRIDAYPQLHEATFLRLDCSKARSQLGWYPRWPLEHALAKIIDWAKKYQRGTDMRQVCFQQIDAYMRSVFLV